MIHLDKKYQCLHCKVIFSKRELENKKRTYYSLQDYMWEGLYGVDKMSVQHWKDHEYHEQGGIAVQEDMCGNMTPLDDNGNPVICFICNTKPAIYNTKRGQSCYSCIWKALKKCPSF